MRELSRFEADAGPFSPDTKTRVAKIATTKKAAMKVCHRLVEIFEAFITFFVSREVMQYKQKRELSSISALQ